MHLAKPYGRLKREPGFAPENWLQLGKELEESQVFQCDNPECKRIFCLPGRVTVERKPIVFTDSRMMVEIPICPHCEKKEFHEVIAAPVNH